MTDFSSRDLDALASDLVDGLLPPDEAARARQDPEVAARVASIEAMRSALRSVPPADPAMTDRIVAAAVAAASSPVEELPQTRRLTAVPPPPPPPPARPVHPSTRRWLAAAAAVVAVVGLVTAGLLTRSDHGSDDLADVEKSGADARASDSPAAGAPSSTTSRTDAAEGGNEAPQSSAPSTSSSTSPGVLASGTDLGAVDDAEELAALVTRQGVDDEVSTTAKTSQDTLSANGDAGEVCAGRTDAGDPSRGGSIFWATATYAGSPVVVHVYEHDGERRLVATGDDCRDLVDVPYGD